MTCSQWNDVILFLLLCRWSNFKIGTFRQVTTATKYFLAWQTFVALKWDLWISVTKGACCLVLIVTSDQPTNGRTKLFSSYLWMFWMKFRWRLVFLDLLEAVHEKLLLHVPLAEECQEGRISNFEELLSWNRKQTRWELVSLQTEHLHMEVKRTRNTEPVLSEFDFVLQLQGWI